MIFGTHYYVLSLSSESTALYEAFRDTLIPVEDQGFPVTPTIRGATPPSRNTPHDLMRAVDERFEFFDARERLGLLLAGDEELQAAFEAVTAHGDSVVGRVQGDRSGLGAPDLGQIVWPVVKEVISAVRDRAMSDLAECTREGRVVAGLEAVALAATSGARGTLLVEDGFRVRGSLNVAAPQPVVSADVDIRDAHDDAVDAVIERVLGSGGNVVFLQDGALADRGRITLLPKETIDS